MSEISEPVAWRRRGMRQGYVGSLLASVDGIRLTGRQPRTGVDVALSIPLGEVDHVDVADAGVVLDLAESRAIVLSPIAATSHMLARSLGALTGGAR